VDKSTLVLEKEIGSDIQNGRTKRMAKASSFACMLALLLLAFLVIESFVPMSTAVQIGADEGFELAKATLCLQGHHLYTEVWNDQPPLHTFLVTQILKHISISVLGPRLLTVGFSAVLLTAVFLIVRQVSGRLVAMLTTGMLIASPGFVELSSSCMLEIPALGTALAAIALLCWRGSDFAQKEVRENLWTPTIRLIVAGSAFGLALQIKLVPVIYLPLAVLIIVLREWNGRDSLKRVFVQMILFGVALVVAYVGLDLMVERGAYLTHFGQSWKSHFGQVRPSLEYGSPRDHPFDWSVLLKNWDVTVPAILGLIVSVRCLKNNFSSKECSHPFPLPRRDFAGVPTIHAAFRNPQSVATHNGGFVQIGCRTSYTSLFLPLAWLALTFGVFGIHKPWWAYYYVHTSIPMCWCAAIGLGFLVRWITGQRGANPEKPRRPRAHPSKAWLVVALGACIFAAGSIGWIGARVYLQVANLRDAPKIQSTPVIAQLQRFRPYVQWLYTDKLVYSFHSGIPVVPTLAVMPIKRLWSGELDNARIRQELEHYKPEVTVLLNDGRDVPFKDFLDAQYQMAYMDSENRMYVLRIIAGKVMMNY
jgi:hypothetical protein